MSVGQKRRDLPGDQPVHCSGEVCHNTFFLGGTVGEKRGIQGNPAFPVAETPTEKFFRKRVVFFAALIKIKK